MTLPSLRWFSLRTRFVLGVGSMLLPLVLLAAIAFYSRHVTEQSLEKLVLQSLEEKDLVIRLQPLVHETMALPHRLALAGSAEDRERLQTLILRIDQMIAPKTGIRFNLEEEQESFARATAAWHRARATAEAILALPAPDHSPEIPALLQELRQQGETVIAELEWIEEIVAVEITDLLAAARRLEAQMRWWIGCIFLTGVGIALTSGILLARSVLRPMRELEAGAKRFAAGELSFRLVPCSRDEISQLIQTFNAMAAALEENQRSLRELSVRDQLTGLFNHREFYRLLGEELARSRRYSHPLALLMLDIDYFKRVNDTYGHPAGDQALRRLPELIRSQLRVNDLPCRYGGEEFGLILPETGPEQALEVAERIRATVAREPIDLPDGGRLRISVSIGVAGAPRNGVDEERLVAAADLALYEAKRTGRNRVCMAASDDTAGLPRHAG